MRLFVMYYLGQCKENRMKIYNNYIYGNVNDDKIFLHEFYKNTIFIQKIVITKKK